MPYFNIVAETNENTVVTEYEPVKKRSDAYQSEAELEQEFIRLLCEQGYEYLPIHTEEDLIQNLRTRLEDLNDYKFSDTEWERFFTEKIANKNEGIVDKTRKIQEDSVQVLKRDDAMSKNIMLIDKKQVHNNRLQVINQYVIGQDQGAKHDNRYDVTILVNGLPLVHIELKRRGVAIREAFNQINRYQRDSFWAGSGLFEYVQIFVISNGTNTKYYSNSTRWNAIKDANSGKTKKEKTSNSFEFTSFWADASNKVIPDLIDFTKTFFAKHSILNILTKYCIFTSENMLMVMRPYQITASELYSSDYFDDLDLKPLLDYSWNNIKNIRKIDIDLICEEYGFKGKGCIGILIKNGLPAEEIEILSKDVEIDGEIYTLSSNIKYKTNCITETSTSISVDEDGEIDTNTSWSERFKSKASLSIHGIEVPYNLFPDYSNRMSKAVLKIPFPFSFRLDIGVNSDLNLNSARDQIIYDEKWLTFEENLYRIICRRLKDTLSSSDWKILNEIIQKNNTDTFSRVANSFE